MLYDSMETALQIDSQWSHRQIRQSVRATKEMRSRKKFKCKHRKACRTNQSHKYTYQFDQ